MASNNDISQKNVVSLEFLGEISVKYLRTLPLPIPAGGLADAQKEW